MSPGTPCNVEIVIVLGWAAGRQGLGPAPPNREQSLFLVFHDKEVS